MPTPIRLRMITRQPQWDRLARVLARQKKIAVDLESNGFHRYPEKICLIQIGIGSQVYLVDPLTISNLSALGEILANPKTEKIFHSCENDLRALDRDYGFHVSHLFDTALAAHFVGLQRLGLGHVLQEYLQVDIPKSKQLQRQDWTLRPLQAESQSYAAGDVAHLMPLRERLAERLNQLGRREWVQEEFKRLEQIRHSPPPDPGDQFGSVKGSHELSARERAILKELFLLREKTARALDRPPFRVLSNEVLLVLAKNPDHDLTQIKGLTLMLRGDRKQELISALRRGKRGPGLPKITAPRSGMRRRGSSWQNRLNELKAWREKKGHELQMDPSLIWPLRHLDILATHESVKGPLLLANPEVRIWQQHVFGPELQEQLARITSQANQKNAEGS